MKEKDSVMTVDEVAEYLRLSRATVLSLIKKNAIPVYRIGKRSYRFFEFEIKEWINNIEIQSDAADQEDDETKDFMELSRKRKGFIHEENYETACNVLKDTGLLDALPFEDVETILKYLDYKHLSFEKGDYLIRKDDEIQDFLVLYEGELYIPLGDEKHIVKVNTFWKENIIGLDILNTPLRTSYYDLYAHTKGKAIYFNFDRLFNLKQISREANVKLLLNMAGYISEERIRDRKKLEILQVKTHSSGILAYLIQKEEAYGGSPFNLDPFHEIAKHLNMSNSSFSSSMKNLKNRNVISVEGQKIWVHHPQADEYIGKE